MPPRNVHLVGSVPMANAHEVFETVSAALGPRLKRMPDGETGERSDWITWLEPVFADNPALEKSGELFRVHASAPDGALRASRRGRRRRTCASTTCSMPISRWILRDVRGGSSSRARSAGMPIPGRSGAGAFGDLAVPGRGRPARPLDPDLQRGGQARDRQDRRRSRTTSSAIQFDVASAVFARLERNEPSSYGRNKAEMQETFSNILVDLGNRVPADIDLLYHFCYGDSNHRHVVEPTDMGDMVEFANCLARDRAAGPAHPCRCRATVPTMRISRRCAVRAAPRDELCLGLVHHTDGGRGHAAAARNGGRICAGLRHRDRMRLRPPAEWRLYRSCCGFTPRRPNSPRNAAAISWSPAERHDPSARHRRAGRLGAAVGGLPGLLQGGHPRRDHGRDLGAPATRRSRCMRSAPTWTAGSAASCTTSSTARAGRSATTAISRICSSPNGCAISGSDAR